MDAPPPATEAEVPPLYLRQLSAYRAALAQIYPDREIRCALLWAEGPRLIPISPDLLAGHLPGAVPEPDRSRAERPL